MSMESIRKAYDVPAYRGRCIKFNNRRGRILSASRGTMHLFVQLAPTVTRPAVRVMLHPTWEVDYLDGRGVR